MLVTKARFQTASQRLIGQQRIEVHGHFGHADTMAVRGNRGMEIGQRARVIDPVAFGHEAVE